MRIDETEQHRFSAPIYRLRVPVTHTPHIIVAAHRQDTPTHIVDSHRLRSRLRSIHRVDRAIEINHNAHSFLAFQCNPRGRPMRINLRKNPSAPRSPLQTIHPPAGFLAWVDAYCLEIKYTLTMINIPPTIVVGSS